MLQSMDAMDLVRRLFADANAGDVDAVLRWYDTTPQIDVVGASGSGLRQGHEAVRDAWGGALAGRYDVRRVAGIETGWGWVRADWVRGTETGYAYFWIEGDRIRRHRHVFVGAPGVLGDQGAPQSTPDPSVRPRRGPSKPVFGVGAVTFDDAGRVLLVRRKHEPLAGQWSLPGGRLELGETLEAATAREMREETGLIVDVGPLVEVFDRILLDADGAVQFHFVIADYLCNVVGGELCAGSDVSDVVWATRDDVPAYVATEKAKDVIAKAVTMWNQGVR